MQIAFGRRQRNAGLASAHKLVEFHAAQMRHTVEREYGCGRSVWANGRSGSVVVGPSCPSFAAGAPSSEFGGVGETSVRLAFRKEETQRRSLICPLSLFRGEKLHGF